MAIRDFQHSTHDQDIYIYMLTINYVENYIYLVKLFFFKNIYMYICSNMFNDFKEQLKL